MLLSVRRRLKTAGKVVALAALVVLGFAAVASAAGTTLLYSDWGRERLKRWVVGQANGAMMGELQIDRIERVALPWVHARGVRIVAPDGVPAIDVRKVRFALDLGALREGRFAWHRAEIDGGIVRVTEDARGRVNMEETFRARKSGTHEDQEPPKEGALDLRTMITSDMTLVIRGGSLPHLRMEQIHGIMRIQTHADASVTLRFDDYRGHFVKGLPTGRLDFEDVKGQVLTDKKRLLRFEGRGRSEGEPVAFTLDIHTEPKTLVEIDAEFPRLSAESLATLGFAGYTKFTKDLDLDVKPGRIRRER
jgi:hypothetical protein